MAKFKFPFFVAEISANHFGSLDYAKRLISLAKKYKANAVKIQSFKPELMTFNSNKKIFKIKKGLWKNKTFFQLYQQAKTPEKWHLDLFDHAKKENIKLFSSPFDNRSVDLLEKFNCPIYKIASFEINDLELLKKIASTKKPVIMSNGASSLKETEIAYNHLIKNGTKDIAILYCVSSYPAKKEEFNLNNIQILKKKFNCPIGFSDHTESGEIAYSAVLSGAEIVEKHISLNLNKEGIDSKFSSKGDQIKKYINSINSAKKLLGHNFFYRAKSEKKQSYYKRSLFAFKKIKKGEKFTKKNLISLRPAAGISPIYLPKLLNKKSPENINIEEPIKKKILKKLKIKILKLQ